MDKQAMKIESDLTAVVYRYVWGFICLVDIVIFEIAIDYIIRNFDPTGINIGGIINSFYYVFIKPVLKRIIYV